MLKFLRADLKEIIEQVISVHDLARVPEVFTMADFRPDGWLQDNQNYQLFSIVKVGMDGLTT